MMQTIFFVKDLQVDNNEEGGEPTKDAELYEMILDERLCGAAAQAIDNHILEIA